MIADIKPTDGAFSFSAECGNFRQYEPPPTPASIIVPGIHVVGSDIEPGLYRAEVTASCYWERRSAMSAEVDEIIASATEGPGWSFVEVRATDHVFVNGSPCTWLKMEPGFDDLDGVPAAQDNCPYVPNPDQSDRYGSSKGDACEDDSNGDGILDVDVTDICVHIDGRRIVPVSGVPLAFCFSTATTGDSPNIAVTHGVGSASAAYGNNNTATADGFNAGATATDGDNNTATADGSDSRATAGSGDNNTAVATNGGDARAEGDNMFACADEPGEIATNVDLCAP